MDRGHDKLFRLFHKSRAGCWFRKRQRAAALQDASRDMGTNFIPPGLGVRLGQSGSDPLPL